MKTTYIGFFGAFYRGIVFPFFRRRIHIYAYVSVVHLTFLGALHFNTGVFCISNCCVQVFSPTPHFKNWIFH